MLPATCLMAGRRFERRLVLEKQSGAKAAQSK
jgi:hypothetical protein